MVLYITFIIDAACRPEKSGNKNNYSENYSSPCTVVFGLAEAFKYKYQPKWPSQDAAKPYGQFILFGIIFFCNHILFPFECDLI